MHPYQDPSKPTEERIEDLLARMTLKEKLGQLIQLGLNSNYREVGRKDEALLEDVRSGLGGSRILADGAYAGNDGSTLDLESLRKTQEAALQSRLGIPVLFGRDVIYGQKTVFPIPLAQAASFRPRLTEVANTAIAKEATALGIHWTFAPMMDVARDPRWGRVIECAGEDPYLSVKMAAAAVRGYQGEDPSAPDRLAACAKHFVGYGAAEGGRDYDTSEISEYSLRNTYLPPFYAAVKEGVLTLMSAFQDISGVPASGNHHTLTEVLKEEWGFEGFVVSDYFSVAELADFGLAADWKEAGEIGLMAGVDMEMVQRSFSTLEQSLEEGKVSQERIDDAVRRVLRVKFRSGLFEHPWPGREDWKDILFCDEHRALALESAASSMVLLRNRSDLLPLPKDTKVAVIGPFAHERRSHLGSWCLDGQAEDVTTLYEGMLKYAAEGCLSTTQSALSDDQLGEAMAADLVVLCVGESHWRNGEGCNITKLELPPGQEALIESIATAGKPLVIVNCSGRPLPSPAAERHAEAILYAWQSGTSAGDAVASILYGEREAGGRLPMSIPRSTGQVPVYYNRRQPGKFYEGYRPYKDDVFAPLYPFGFGLGYTNWSYEQIELEQEQVPLGSSVTVRCQVRNTGSRKGSTIVQCYLRDKVASRVRPIRQLVGFEDVTLEAGASETVSFELGSEELGFYLPGQGWVVEAGEFDLWIGGDSQAELVARFALIES